jgi:hypothetical protein
VQVHPLSDESLVDVWEAGQPRAPLERAVLILSAACPDAPPDELFELPVGERDRRLLLARAATFGRHVRGLADCPACGQTTEFQLDAVDLAASDRAPAAAPLAIERDGYTVSFRVPDTRDLAAIAAGGTGDPAGELLQRCVLSAAHVGTSCDTGVLPAAVLTAVEEEMARADPYADLRLALDCPGCGHRWTMAFDVASFFWRELEGRAMSLIRDVHELALAYGWCERDILEMSVARRALYLEMVRT